jgi:hypothetical protein
MDKDTLIEMRRILSIEYNKANDEAWSNPFKNERLDREHLLLWRGHANAYSETISYIDQLLGNR